MEKNLYMLVIAFGHNAHIRNGPVWKEKWTTIYNNYKQIQDYIVGTRHNEELWNMFTIDRVSMNLPKVFYKNSYEMIDSFMKAKPIFQPPHFRDFMDPNDVMYSPLL